MKLIMYERAFGGRALNQPSVDLQIQRYSRSVFAGAKDATVMAYGDELNLWELVERIRCPVEFYSDIGDRVWNGYVAGISLQIGHVALSVSIDSMYNRVAVAYNNSTPGTSTVGARATTAWVEDAESVAIFGKRELLQTISGSVAAHAEAARDMLLNQKRYPIPAISMSGNAIESPQVELLCRGWFSTLDWLYCSSAAADTDTGTQATLIADTAGQFFSDVVGVTSGITTNAFRDGDGRTSYELGELMKMGTSNFRRLLAEVDENRLLTIYEEPAVYLHPWLIDSRGDLRDRYDNPVRRETCPVGMWARLKDVIPPSVDASRLSDPSMIFVDESEYEVATDTLRFTPRDIENPWEIGRPKDG